MRLIGRSLIYQFIVFTDINLDLVLAPLPMGREYNHSFGFDLGRDLFPNLLELLVCWMTGVLMKVGLAITILDRITPAFTIEHSRHHG